MVFLQKKSKVNPLLVKNFEKFTIFIEWLMLAKIAIDMSEAISFWTKSFIENYVVRDR